MVAELDFCLLGSLRLGHRGLTILWGSDVRPSGPVTVQNCVLRLRKGTRDAKAHIQPPAWLAGAESSAR